MKKLVLLVKKTQIGIGGICLAVFFLTVIFQIFSRHAGIHAMWTEDVSQYSFIWAVFMGASAMVYEMKHFAFTSFSDKIKNNKGKTILQIIIMVIILIFSFLMTYYGILITRQFWNYRWINIPSFKRGPVWLCLPVSGGLSAVYCLDHIVSQIQFLCKVGLS
jgi:TRAP-type C4-dicarboxylate transport system permease small subunit